MVHRLDATEKLLSIRRAPDRVPHVGVNEASLVDELRYDSQRLVIVIRTPQ